jgi:hypothetical protein
MILSRDEIVVCKFPAGNHALRDGSFGPVAGFAESVFLVGDALDAKEANGHGLILGATAFSVAFASDDPHLALTLPNKSICKLTDELVILSASEGPASCLVWHDRLHGQTASPSRWSG